MSRRRLPPVAAAAHLLAGRYGYEGELGRGGSGRVIALRDRDGSGRVAKVLDADAGARAQWELDALLRASSPHLAEALELLRVSEPLAAPWVLPAGAWVLVEARAAGEPSAQVIAAAGDVTQRAQRVLAATLGVARALAALHARGLSHGDVKPDNVLLEHEHATLVDLGAAAPFGRDTTLSGTWAFMAPEAREGERSISTDLYSLGATIVAWMTGAPPADVVEAPLAPLWSETAWPPQTSPSLEVLTRALLAPQPAARPRDAHEAIALAGGTRLRRDALVLPSRPALVGFEHAIAKLVALLERDGWAFVVGPAASGRTRLIEEAARVLQRERARAAAVVPTVLRVSSAPERLVAASLIHLERADASAQALVQEAAQVLRAGRIGGHRHRVVIEASDASGVAEPHLVRVPTLEPDETRTWLASLLGETPSAAMVSAALDASGGFAAGIVRGLRTLSSMELDPLRAQEWSLVARLRDAPSLPRHVQELVALASTLAGEILLDGPLPAGPLAEAARWLIAEGLASVRGDGAFVLRAHAAVTPSPSQRAMALRTAAALPLAGLSRAVRDAHSGRGEQADRHAHTLANAARERGAPEDAAGLLHRYLDAAPRRSDATRATLAFALSDAERAVGTLGAAISSLDAHDGDGATTGATGLLRAELARLRGDLEEVLTLTAALCASQDTAAEATALLSRALLTHEPERAITLAQSLSASVGPAAARAAETLALAAISDRRFEDALRHARSAERASDAIETTHVRRAARARARSLEAQALAQLGHLAQAREAHAQSAQLAAEAGDRLLEASFRANEGASALEAGGLGEALTALEASARLFLRLERPRELARSLANLANAYELVGDDARARVIVEEADQALAAVDDADARALLAIVRAELLVHRGKLRAAAAVLETPEGQADAHSDVARIRALRRVTVHAAAGQLAEAEGVLAQLREHDEESPLLATERALAEARLALARQQPTQAARALEPASAHVAQRRVGFEASRRTLTLEVEIEEALGQRARARLALARLRATIEPTLRGLSVELQARFRQIPTHRRALSEGVIEHGATSELHARALEGLAVLAREPRMEAFERSLATLALTLTAAERAFVVEWRPEGPEVRARAGAGHDEAARPSTSIVARALREKLVVSTDALHEHDASSSVHALALRSVLAIEIAPRPAGSGPRVLVVDDPLRPAAFDATVVEVVRDVLEVAGPLLAARIEARRARLRERRAGHREAALEVDAARLREEAEGRGEPDAFSSFVHEQASSARLVEEARRLATSELPVLLVGETGVGKDLLARALHRASPRRHEPFVVERAANLAGPLADATLFGHTRGAFTGAETARKGLFELAHRGTLYLDGLEELPLVVQAKLLRILVDGEVRPLGTHRARRVDVRVVASLREPPDRVLARGALREDLYYRLAGAVLAVAPLRERPADLEALLDRVLARAGREIRLTTRAREALRTRRWPGNVRELEHTLMDATLRAAGDVVDLEHLAPIPVSPDEIATPTLHERRGALTREVVLGALERHDGNRTHAARALGLSRFGLQKILRRLGLVSSPQSSERARK